MQTNVKHLTTPVNLVPFFFCRLSPEERAHVEAQLDELKTTYNQLCDSSTQQLQQLEQQLAKEEERKVDRFGWGGPSGEKGVCRFMANMYSAYASLNKNNHKGTLSLYVGQQIIIYVVQHVVCSPICISEKHHQS